MRSIVVPILAAGSLLIVPVTPPSTAVAQVQAAGASGETHYVTSGVSRSDTVIRLPHEFVVAGRERVELDSLPLSAGTDYLLDARFGTIRLFRLSSLDTSRAHTISVRYISLPFSFRQRYAHRTPVTVVDSGRGGNVTIGQVSAPFSVDDMFGAQLQKSGSILRGFTVGSNQDLSVNSGFRMQMSGNLSSDLQLVAALTDENSPIQPEGTTQTLQEVDNVFIELRGSRVAATLGDFTLNIDGGEFGRLHRKLQGGKGFLNIGSNEAGGNLLVAGATTRGKFTTNELQGLDGVQGPYRLNGTNGERTMIVVAGTEKVYVNGELMTRGELGDYIIDYANAEITFRQRKLISRVSRITVDFEYSDRQFPRSLIGGQAGAAFLDDAIVLSTTILRESDDENSPIEASLSQEDKDTLAAAGSDPEKAVRSGVTFVGPGNGQYLAKDTIYFSSQTGDTVHELFYRYAPDSAAQAEYSVSFSAVGTGRGSYSKVSTYEFTYVGRNLGSYEPVHFLPVPQATSLADVRLAVRVNNELSLSGEYAGSRFDANKFAPGARSDGTSNSIGVRYMTDNLRIGSANLGALDMKVSRRFVGSTFVPIDRVNEIEFNRKWNAFDTSRADEELLDAVVAYRPLSTLLVNGEIGSRSHGEGTKTNRFSGGMHLRDAALPDAGYGIEYIESSDDALARNSRWIRQRANVADTVGIFVPALRYDGERLLNTAALDGAVLAGSFRFNEIDPAVEILLSRNLRLAADYSWRQDDSARSGVMESVSKTFGQGYHLAGRAGNGFLSSVDVGLKRRVFTPQFTYGNDDDISTVLVRAQAKYAPFERGVETDLYYEASTERAAKLERVYQRVQRGTGNYVYAGDLNNNHLSDAEEFVLSRFDADYILLTFPTDNLVPVVNLKSSLRLRLNGSILMARDAFLGDALSQLSTETYLRVEERSTTTHTADVYALHLSTFLNEGTTLGGANIVTQDVYFRESDPEFSVRLRYLQRNGLNSYDVATERTYAREQSIRLRCRLVEEIANETDVSLKTDNLSSRQTNANVRQIDGADVKTRFSYKFERNVELSFGIELGGSTNEDTTSASFNDEGVEVLYSLTERAQAKFDFVREEVVLSNAPRSVPYELTNGRVEGRTWLWKGSIDYRFGQNVQATVAYDGRSEGSASPVHTVRATVRAFF